MNKPPIFVIGAGRSGSTVLHRLLSEHPNLAWMSWQCARHPHRPELNRRVMHAIDLPVVGTLLSERLFRGEFYPFWDEHFRGFSTPFRELTENDVTAKVSKTLPRLFSSMTTPKRYRMLVKITGWSRIRFLREIFPHALFIHIVRDGRAVANSLLQVDFWRGWQGPSKWRWGPLSKSQQAEWEKYDCSFLALAAIQWKILMDSVHDAASYLESNSFLEIKYEDLCENPHAILGRITEFCGLPSSTQLERAIGTMPLESANRKWAVDLTDRQQRILNEVLLTHLLRFGYVTNVNDHEELTQGPEHGSVSSLGSEYVG